jgi:hypothetical protein
VKKSDYPEFTTVWLAAAEIYGKTPSDAAVVMAFRSLLRFELQDVKRAITAHVNDTGDGRFMPKPADLIRHIEGDTDSRALIAWSKVEDTMRLVGSWQSVIFDDPLIMACLEEMGGWLSMCKTSSDELPFKRQEFTKRYRGYLNRPPSRHPTHLIGDIEAEAERLGQQKPDPVLVGDTETALAVHRLGDRGKPRMVALGQALKSLGYDSAKSDDDPV